MAWRLEEVVEVAELAERSVGMARAIERCRSCRPMVKESGAEKKSKNTIATGYCLLSQLPRSASAGPLDQLIVAHCRLRSALRRSLLGARKTRQTRPPSRQRWAQRLRGCGMLLYLLEKVGRRMADETDSEERAGGQCLREE